MGTTPKIESDCLVAVTLSMRSAISGKLMPHILMVDDDAIFSDLIINALMDEGHVVGACRNGLEALSAMKFRLPKLMILDCNMPEMSGIELLRHMRRDERLFAVPVLMLTVRDGKQDESIGRYEGATDYLAKPVAIEELLHAVDQLLARPQSKAPMGAGFGTQDARFNLSKVKRV